MFTNFRRYSITSNKRLESNRGTSVTVPDMSIPLRTLIDRHLQGGKVKTFRGEFIPVDSSVPITLERMDPLDRAQLAKELGDFVSTSRGKLITAKQAREAAERELLRSGSQASPDLPPASEAS